MTTATHLGGVGAMAALIGIVTVDRCSARLPCRGGDTIVNVTCAPQQHASQAKPPRNSLPGTAIRQTCNGRDSTSVRGQLAQLG